MYQKVADTLNELGITFQIVEHEPVLTTEQADRFIEGIEGVRTKSMFLTNKKKRNFYLVIMDDVKRLDMDVFKDIVEEKQMKMASAETLNDKMMLLPGTVSPFGLLNNRDKDIQVYFDQEIVSEERMSFHPNTNEKTIFVNTQDLFTFLKAIDYEPHVIEL